MDCDYDKEEAYDSFRGFAIAVLDPTMNATDGEEKEVTSCSAQLSVRGKDDPPGVCEREREEPARTRMRLFALRVRAQPMCVRGSLHGRGRDCSLSACACSRCVRE